MECAPGEANIKDLVRELRIEMLSHGTPTPRLVRYVKHHGLDLRMIERFAGILVVCRLQFTPEGTFDFDDHEGVACACTQVFGWDAESVIDLVAWPLHRPRQFATAFRYGELLGADQLTNPATFFAGDALRIHRTPLGWLRNGCKGIVLLKPEGARHLVQVPRIAGEDLAHAHEIAHMLPVISRSRILAPLTIKEAA